MTRSTNPFRYFDSSPEVIRLVVMMYVRRSEAQYVWADKAAETSTANDAQPPWLSGAPSWARAGPGLGELRQTGDELPLD